MTRKLIALLLLLITTAVLITLSTAFGPVPPVGKFLSPSHGFWKNIDAEADTNYIFTIKGPRNPVKVVYDERGIPHIFAQTDEDLYYAQGFVMAKDRLWQMDFISYAASGRLSEIVGEVALETDRYNRRIGLKHAAELSMERLKKEPATELAVNAFADGVNAYIQQLKPANYPVEYKLLSYKPEAWTPLKSALLLKYMANDLTGSDDDLEYSNALKLFGTELFEQMYPQWPEQVDPIIPLGTAWPFEALQPKKLETSDATETAFFQNPFRHLHPPAGLGSNNWAVHGSKTASGKPLLCNDPHLSLSLPSIWYEMQLSTPEMNVYGVTLPGSPGIVIGYNENIAWGVTNAGMDVRDWYSLEINPKNQNEYLVEGDWKTFETIEEVYKVKGQKDFRETVKWTVVGPVVYDEAFVGKKRQPNLAQSWLALRPTNELRTFLELNRAKNHSEYLQALDHFWCPAQNFVYADISNNVAIKEQGRFWIRHPEQGKFVQELASADLTSIDSHFIPNEHNPYVLNPPRGFVSSANQVPVGPDYPYYIFSTHYENYRNRRINEFLAGLEDATIDDMKTLHYDNVSVIARENLPYWLALTPRPESGDSRRIYQALSKWNFVTDYDSEASSYFYKWLSYVEKLTWDELEQGEVSLSRPHNYTTMNLIKRKPDFPLFDLTSTADKKENAQDIVQLAFDSTVSWFANNQEKSAFRMYKNTALTHLARLKPFSLEYLKIGGYNNIVNATSSRWGASVRLIVDFADGRPQGYGMYPGGQSGNPGSSAYTAFAEAWTDGHYYKHHFFKNLKDAEQSISKK